MRKPAIQKGSSSMLTVQQREIVKATVPALREHGETITRTFYGDMFAAHPELYNLFNPANQRDGGQARSLAASVLTYAEHIDAPERLGRMVERIAGKHGSLEVRPEHYPIVGEYLLGAVAKVLGAAATPEIVNAWQAAYGQLAEIMIGRERTIYDEGANQPGGWHGFKPFHVERRVQESEVMTSFYCVPVDGAPLPAYKPGQYVSVNVHPPGFPYDQIRQYSLSCAPNGRHYRISVKREDAPQGVAGAPPGLVSNYLHESVREGGTLLVHVPLGDFVLDETSDRPVVLMSGGAGITAVLAMLEHLAGPRGNMREVVFLRGVRSRARHPFANEVRALARQRPGIQSVVLYEQVGPEDIQGEHYDAVGRTTANTIRQYLPTQDADFYYCGPLGFMAAAETALNALSVPAERRHSEAFAPDQSFTPDPVQAT
jgi:nitric oxide dioxygenase